MNPSQDKGSQISTKPLAALLAFVETVELPEYWGNPEAERPGGKPHPEQLKAYGVVNAHKLPGGSARFPMPAWTRRWWHVHNFLWFGVSPGGMHYDEMDNILIQLHGTKTVHLYPPQVQLPPTTGVGGLASTSLGSCHRSLRR